MEKITLENKIDEQRDQKISLPKVPKDGEGKTGVQGGDTENDSAEGDAKKED